MRYDKRRIKAEDFSINVKDVVKKEYMQAKDCKCSVCGKQAVAFWPCIDPDIPRRKNQKF